MTREEYNKLAPKFDLKQWKIDQEAAQIPAKINRTGTLYRHLLKQIEKKYEDTR